MVLNGQYVPFRSVCTFRSVPFRFRNTERARISRAFAAGIFLQEPEQCGGRFFEDSLLPGALVSTQKYTHLATCRTVQVYTTVQLEGGAHINSHTLCCARSSASRGNWPVSDFLH